MKRFTFFLFALVSFFTAQGSSGIFEAGVIINGTTYIESSNTLNGKSFSVAQGGTLNFTFAYVKTFKNGADDVCGAAVNYAVYPAAGAPSFTTRALCFGSNLANPGDQEWNSTSCAISVNLANGLTAGNYKIAVYYTATVGVGCGSTAFLSNSGANYIANLTITVPLPVTLIAFDARRMETGNQLSWQTAIERDQDSYEIERRAATGAWLPLGSVKARGNTTESTNYTFLDVRPLAGDNYYRLAMQDLSGKTTYSTVVQVEGKYASTWQIAPNPATDELVLRFVEKDAPEAVLVRLYNAQGALALQYNAGDNGTSLRIPLTGLPVGTYWLEIQSGDGVRTALQQVIKR